MTTSRLLFLFVAFALLGSTARAAAPTGRAAGASAKVTVLFYFQIPAAFPPSRPTDLRVADFNGTQLTLEWAPSAPALPDRTISHYDVLCNGVKVATSANTRVLITFHPAGTGFEFITLRAVDNKGVASFASNEVLAPNYSVNNPVQVEVQAKTAAAHGFKFGFPGFRRDGRFYQRLEYAADCVWGDPWGAMSFTLTISSTISGETGTTSTSASGNFSSFGEPDYPERGTFRVSPGDPHVIELVSEAGTVSTWLTLRHRLASGEIFADAPSSGSDTDLSTNVDFDAFGYSKIRYILSNEYTTEALAMKVNRRYSEIFNGLGRAEWDSAIRLDDEGESAGRLGRWSGFAHHADDGSLEGMTEEELGGGIYRLKVLSLGPQLIRWAEVTVPVDGSPQNVRIREETVDVRDINGGYTLAYTLAPPAVQATVYVHVLNTQLMANTLAVVGAATASPGSSLRLFVQNAVFKDQAAELVLGSAMGEFGNGNFTSAIITYGGDSAIRVLAIDPQLEAQAGTSAAIAASEAIASGTDLLAHPRLPGFPELGGWKLVAVGLKLGSVPIQIAVTNSFEPTPRVLALTLSVYPRIQLAVDANRDGQIALTGESDQTSASRPYRFWLNDDSDSGEDKKEVLDDLPLAPGTAGRNADDNVVNGIRDLVDFFPVCVDVKQLFPLLPPRTNGISYRLRQDDDALGFVFTNVTSAQPFEYLRGVPGRLDSGFGPTLRQKAGEATVSKLTAAGVDLFLASPEFESWIRTNEAGVILVEANAVTAKPLVLEVRQGSDVLVSVQLELKTDPVESMFRYCNLRALAHGTPIAGDNQGPGFGESAPTEATNDPFQELTNRKNAVFVHGYNVNSRQAQGSAAEVFKRLYWAGSKAKFHAVLWRGDDGQGAGVLPTYATPDYHRNVGHAWQQGIELRGFLATLKEETAVIAHSLGNMVTLVALTYEKDPADNARIRPATRPPMVRNYFAIDAAVPLEALDSNAITTEGEGRMRHPDWAEFDKEKRLWPAHWWNLFGGSSDARARLTWRDVFSRLEIGTNLYSSGEDVLANPIDDSVPIWGPAFGGGFRAWVSQEKQKGGAGIAAPLLRSRTGGWVANRAWYVSIVPRPPANSPQLRRRFASEAHNDSLEGVATSALPAEPFFQRFQAEETSPFYPGYEGRRLHAPIGDSKADAEARKLVTIAKCLGEAIPALSFALGSNTLVKFEDLGGTIDLNESIFKNGWPSSRANTRWLHSDCLNVAYVFNFALYDLLVTDGNLK